MPAPTSAILASLEAFAALAKHQGPKQFFSQDDQASVLWNIAIKLLINPISQFKGKILYKYIFDTKNLFQCSKSMLQLSLLSLSN